MSFKIIPQLSCPWMLRSLHTSFYVHYDTKHFVIKMWHCSEFSMKSCSNAWLQTGRSILWQQSKFKFDLILNQAVEEVFKRSNWSLLQGSWLSKEVVQFLEKGIWMFPRYFVSRFFECGKSAKLLWMKVMW
jgi:hypothetical protein